MDMPTKFIVSKSIFYILSFALVFILNFSFVQHCINFKKKFFQNAETNLNKAGYSFFPKFYFSLDLKDLKNEERWLGYIIVTIPALAICIRCIYYDHSNMTYGYYVFVWQIILQLMAFLYAKYNFKQYCEIEERLIHSDRSLEILKRSPDLSKEEVEKVIHSLTSFGKIENSEFDLLKKLDQKKIQSKPSEKFI